MWSYLEMKAERIILGSCLTVFFFRIPVCCSCVDILTLCTITYEFLRDKVMVTCGSNPFDCKWFKDIVHIHLALEKIKVVGSNINKRKD